MFDAYIKGIYKIWARIYDGIIDRLFQFDRTAVVKALKAKPKDKVLEVGIGTGLNLPHYPRCNVIGIDFSEDMLNRAKDKKSKANVTLKLLNANKLPFKDNSFDKAITTYVLRVSPDPKKIMTEVSRVVKKGGTFVILDQFKRKHNMILDIMQPFKILMGWGKEHDINELTKNTSWKIISNKKFGLMESTRLVVLKN